MTSGRRWLPWLGFLAAAFAGVGIYLWTRGAEPELGTDPRSAFVPGGESRTGAAEAETRRPGEPIREATREIEALEARISVVDGSGFPVENAIVLAASPSATVEQTGAVHVVRGRLPVSVLAFANGYSGSVTLTIDRTPEEPRLITLTREVKFPVKIFREDGTSPGPLTGYVHFRCGQARGYARVDVDAMGECAAVAGPEGSANFGFASEAYEGPAVERTLGEGALLSIAVRKRPTGTLRVKCQDLDLMPPSASFPILPPEAAVSNALAPHALRQASRRDGEWYVFEEVAAGSVLVVARDGPEAKEARRVVELAAGATAECVLE